MGEKRSYLNPEFELEFTKDAAEWNWDLAKRKINKIFNQRAATKEYEANNPKPKKKRDAVVVHELLHLRYPNHGKMFHTMLNNYLQAYSK